MLRSLFGMLLGGGHQSGGKPSPRPTLRNPKGRVIFAALGPSQFYKTGKVAPDFFFSPFCEELERDGVEVKFVTQPAELVKYTTRSSSVVVHIYNEVRDSNYEPPPIVANIVFNDYPTGRICCNKTLTNRKLADHGVPVPPLVTEASGSAVFSNVVQGSKAEIQVIESGPLDKSRYNTRFIDTVVDVDGQQFHTCVRLICVSGHIVHAYARARPAQERPSVHAADTPLNSKLIEHLQTKLVEPNWSQFEALALGAAKAMGPGFYVHDVLIDQTDGRAYICEVGIKLHDSAYTGRLAPIQDKLPSHKFMFTSAYPRRSARAFLADCIERGAFTNPYGTSQT